MTFWYLERRIPKHAKQNHGWYGSLTKFVSFPDIIILTASPDILALPSDRDVVDYMNRPR